MEDFFKQFRRNLDNRSAPPFEERDWRDMEKRLDREGKRPAGFAWWWAALPLLLLLIGSNALFFIELRKANQKISTLEWQHDTIFQTRVIYVTDTIFQTRIHRETVVVHFGLQNENLHAASFKGDKQFAEKNEIEKVQGKPLPSENQFVATNLKELEMPFLQPLIYSRHFEIPQAQVEVIAKKQKKTLRHHLYIMRPKGFQLGLTGGLVYPSSKGLDAQSGWSAGAQAAIEFAPNLRMWADVAWLGVRFETDRMGDDLGVPVVDPPSDDYIFVKAEVPQPSLQYSIGMQYLFRANKKWQPYVGAGYGAISLLPYEIVYEFENPALGVEWNFDKSVSRSGLLSNFLLLRSGLEFEFSKHWNWQLGATYRMGFGQKGFQMPDIFGLQSGLKYKF